MTLNDICTLNVAFCARDTNLLEAAALMREHHTGTLVVVDDPQGERTPAGIVTDRDIVVEALAQGLDPAKTSVARIIGAKLVIGSAADTLSEAVERMRLHGVRRLPVVDRNGRLTGIVTLDDLLRLHAKQAAALAEIVSNEQAHEQRARR
jgi:CBS domain-containing protein